MAEADKNTRFIAKLIELSQRGAIAWEPHPKGGYSARVFGRDIRVLNIERHQPDWTLGLGSLGKTKAVTVPILEILDDSGQVGYTFEDITGLGNLVFVASYLGSKVNDLVDQVLAS